MKKNDFTRTSESEDLYFMKENDRLIKKIHELKSSGNEKNVINVDFSRGSKSSKNKKAA